MTSIAKGLLLLPWVALACSSSSAGSTSGGGGAAMTDAQYQTAAVDGMHDALLADIETLLQAVKDIQAAAPEPPDRGWDAQKDAAAIQSMREAWVRARTAYEHVEGALAPLFPNLDFSIDARYDDFMTQLAPAGDADLFDDKGVTGMHAVERILYSDSTPARVVAFEKSLPGYEAAAFPATAAEAKEFKEKLCAQLVADVTDLNMQWTPAHIDVAIAFQGLVSLVREQREKVVKASSGEEESRYSQRTMADLRDNLLGSTAVYGLFRPWILSKKSSDPTKDGATIDAAVQKGFDALDVAYKAVSGDAIPPPPADWSAEMPSQTDLATPFGQLYQKVDATVDPTQASSITSELDDAAAVLGFPEFKGGK